jgi:hypothetical protein
VSPSPPLQQAKDLPTIKRFVGLALLLAWLLFCFGALIGFVAGRLA